jgi:hypothetical protein
MFEVDVQGDSHKTTRSLEKMLRGDQYSDFDRYGQMGVRALAAATPVDTGLAQHSWYHIVIKDHKEPGIEWCNRDVENGYPVILLIQYGHGTGTGGYVPGRDIVNSAISQTLEAIIANVWEKVRNA